MFKFWLLDVWSRVENGTETAHLVGFNERNELIELVDSSVRPFLLVKQNEFLRKEFGDENCTVLTKRNGLEDELFLKIMGRDASQDIPRIRDMLGRRNIETFESDIYYNQVYMRARGFRPCSWHIINKEVPEQRYGKYELEGRTVYRIEGAKVTLLTDDALPEIMPMVMDLESYSVGRMANAETDPIILFGLVDGDYNVDMLGKDDTDESGVRLLNRTRDKINGDNPHIVVTFNGNEFDWGYIDERAEICGTQFNIARDGSQPHKTEYSTIAVEGRPTIDLFGLAKFVVPKGSRKTLYHVHAALVEAGLAPKREYYGVDRSGTDKEGVDTNKIGEYWDGGTSERAKVLRHCTSDVVCTMDVFKYAWPFICTLSRLTCLPPDQVVSVPYTILIEGFLMNVSHDLNVLIPNAELREPRQTSGATCMEPKRGVLEDVAVFDFATMYPTILIENNISPETYVPKNELNVAAGSGIPLNVIKTDYGEDIAFLGAPDGFFKISMQRLLYAIALEKEKRKGEKYAQKYAGPVQAIKTMARVMYGYLKAPKSRWSLDVAQEAVASEGRNRVMKAIEKSEDCGFDVTYADTDSTFLENFKEEDCKEFAEVLSEAVGATVGFDKFYKVLFFTDAKKVYAGLTSDGKMEYAGFVKSDWTPIANRLQKKLIEIVLKEKNTQKAVDYVRTVAKGMQSGLFPLKDFIIWKKLRKDFDKYKVRDAHVVVALRNPELFIEEDGTVGYVIVNTGERRRQNLFEKARHYSEVKSVSELDMEYYLKNQLASVANRILKHFLGAKFMVKETYDF
jgi:DNA polymerase I